MQRFLFELFILIMKSIECKISTRAFFVLLARGPSFEIIVPFLRRLVSSQNYGESSLGEKRRRKIRKIAFSAGELQRGGAISRAHLLRNRNNFFWMESFFSFSFSFSLAASSFPLISYQKSRSSSQGKKRRGLTANRFMGIEIAFSH